MGQSGCDMKLKAQQRGCRFGKHSSRQKQMMESSLSFWEYTVILLLRPLAATGFVLSLIALGWLLAWKLVLVHVPLVQEIFGLKKKTIRPKPPTGRLTKIYSTVRSPQ